MSPSRMPRMVEQTHVCVYEGRRWLGCNVEYSVSAASGPRLIYTERNFGELEFIENPLQLLLLPSAGEHSRNLGDVQGLLQRLSENNTTSTVQLLRVREKYKALREVHRQYQQRQPLRVARVLTKEIAAEFSNRLGAYKQQRQNLVDQMRVEGGPRPSTVQDLRALSASFEVYIQTTLGTNSILFERLLQLHLSLLLAHACADEGAGRADGQPAARGSLLFGSCSLLDPWGPPPRSSPRSLADTILLWLWDLVFGLTAHRAAQNSSFPIGDAATLRLSAAADHVARKSGAARAAAISATAVGQRRRAYILPFARLLGARSRRWSTQQPSKAEQRRLSLRGVFAAAGDGLLRQACLQLRSPRRQQQREQTNQLFRRKVASRPADALAFAELDTNLQLVCSLVEIPLRFARSRAPAAFSVAPEAAVTIEDSAARTVADSWIPVELLETKAWVLSRAFDAVTGRLVTEKLLSTFASEQRERQPGIGQWTCQGWKGPTEDRMYRCHLCLLVATLLAFGATAFALLLVVRIIFRASARALVHLGLICCRGLHFSSGGHRRASYENHPVKISQLHQIPRQKVAATAGVIVVIGAAAAIFLCLKNGDMRFSF